jgi:predicted nucleic acid-binding protein
MSARRAIVLDANILIRFVLGEKVSALLAAHSATIDFLAPDTAFEEARKHLPAILHARGDDGTGEAAALEELDAVTAIVKPVPASSYRPMQTAASTRIGPRDPDDWPVLACALLLNCPIWTEDRDFFGVGVATWMTALVELYFTEPDPESVEH